MTKPLRQKMPTVSAWIDDLRAAFGEAEINAAIRAGLDGQPTFYAREGNVEVGTPLPSVEGKAVPLTHMVLGPANQKRKDGQ